MTYPQDLHGALPRGGWSSGHGHAGPVDATGRGDIPAGAYVVPDPNLVFKGEFSRAGVDLLLSRDGEQFVIHDYFKGEKRAPIASPDGAHLTGDLVEALTARPQYAQAGAAVGSAAVIGHVTKLVGSATAIRNGVSIVLNHGDNVEKGDVVSTGSGSTLGISFIDGTVFGLSANARMVLNEMVYEPGGSSNSSLLSLVSGTVSFVAGATAKHGTMKVDTPVGTMGIRGTAVLSQIDFFIPEPTIDVPQPQPQPRASFQVLVEPDGTTGSYILYDKTTLLPIATVDRAGKMIQISGGNVTVSDALFSPEVQKLITDVFTLKFTDNSTDTRLTTIFTDTITPDAYGLPKAMAAPQAGPIFLTASIIGSGDTTPDGGWRAERLPGAPSIAVLDSQGHQRPAFTLHELSDKTGAPASDDVGGHVRFVDPNPGDRPTVTIEFRSFTYHNGHEDVAANLSDLQKACIAATETAIVVDPDAGNTHRGSVRWTYSVPDKALDFLAAGEVLTLTYMVEVDNNFDVSPETTLAPITITIVGTNDRPMITTAVPAIALTAGTGAPAGSMPRSGTLTFSDPDLTDTHTVSAKLTGVALPGDPLPHDTLGQLRDALSVSIAHHHDSTGSGTGTIDWSLADLPPCITASIPKDGALTLTYTVALRDSHGAESTQDIVVTMTAADTQPHVSTTALAIGYDAGVQLFPRVVPADAGAGLAFAFAAADHQKAADHGIDDLAAGQDPIELRQFGGLKSWMQLGAEEQGFDAFPKADDHEMSLLKAIVASDLHARDFIIQLG